VPIGSGLAVQDDTTCLAAYAAANPAKVIGVASPIRHRPNRIGADPHGAPGALLVQGYGNKAADRWRGRRWFCEPAGPTNFYSKARMACAVGHPFPLPVLHRGVQIRAFE
jgi:hypothetical protein